MSAIQENENNPQTTSLERTASSSFAVNLSRAGFISLAWKSLLAVTGLLGLRSLWDFLAYQPYPSPPTVFDLGSLDQFPTSSITSFDDARAVLVRQADVLDAFSTVCPHLGCSVEMDADGFTCPCHGSRFTSLGELERGPASQPLRSLKLEVNDQGHLILDTSEA